jgi:DNA-binding beta-propeller fold protein YncE
MRLLSACIGVALWSVAAAAQEAPRFQVEPFWPKPLPENWILGQVSGIAVAPDDTIWLVHRPASLVDDEKGATLNPPATKCCKAAPAVLAFDADGNLKRSWGGPGEGYDWPKSEHGIHVDKEGNIWLAGNNKEDHQILKFSAEGKFLQQIGKPGAPGGSNSTTQLGSPAHMITDDASNELYVADGYQNRRIIVFDSKSGAYKRHWGAYGKAPPPDDKLPPYRPDAPLSQSFANPVHCVRLANDGLVYVCDRANDRIQVFRRDGTFVKEFRVEPATLQNGSVWDLVLSTDPEQRFIFIADGANGQIHTIAREDGKLLSQWGRHGRQAGQFKWIHNIGIDSKGNLYTAEVGFGRRAQKFRPM